MVIAWNLAIEELTGVKAADMLGKGDFAYAVPLYGEKRPILIDLIFEPDEVITKKYSGIIHKTGNLLIAETTLPGLKGKRRVAWAMASPLYDDEGRVVGAIESIRDITDRKQAEEALRQANRKLNLLSSITRHDILNQLTAVRGYLELAYLNAGDDAGREHVRKAQEAAETIEDQISFTKSYEEIGVHSPVWQNTADLVKKVLSDLRSPPLSCTVDLDNLEVYADPLLEKVFFTFVENSVRHGEHATEIRFSFSVLGSGDLILVYEDNGVGISHYDKEHLFERGYGKNTGLGLFLSREILAITGLTVRETGEPGKGVRFEILVPKEGYRFTPGVLNNQ
jgi:signal transduction histidine kinase